MTRYAIPLLLLLGAICAIYVLLAAGGDGSHKAPLEDYATGELSGLTFATRGAAMPLDEFLGPDGEAISLEAYRGKVLLVNLWATWCAPCEREMPALGALEAAKGGEAFQIIAISVDAEEDHAFARRRLSELGAANIVFHAVEDDAWDITYAAGAAGFPTTVIYNAQGLEVARLSGDADWASLEAVQFIDAVVRGD